MKKILLISNMYPSEDMPHYGVFVKNVENILKERYVVEKIVLKKERSKIKKICNYFLWYLKIIFKGLFGDYQCIYNHFVWINAVPLIIVKFFRREILLVENAHGGDLVSDKPEYHMIKYWAKQVLKVTDYLIVPSVYYAKIAEEDLSFPHKRIFISPSGGINKSIFKPLDRLDCCKELDLDFKKYWYGFVSRIDEDKGWDVFVKAVSKVTETVGKDEIRAIVIGTGPKSEDLKSIISETQTEEIIIVREAVEQAQLAKYYSAMNVYCFPTRRFYDETLGLVGLEAMACGTLCLIADLPGPRSYANENNSLIFNSKSVENCSEKMLQAYYMTKSKRDNYVLEGKKTAEEFSLENVKKELLKFFSNILAS